MSSARDNGEPARRISNIEKAVRSHENNLIAWEINNLSATVFVRQGHKILSELYIYRYIYIYWMANSLRLSDAIRRQRSRSTLAEVMPCCVVAPSHYLSQGWPPISEILWHSPEFNFTASAQATVLSDKFENYTFLTTSTSPGGQWVKLQILHRLIKFIDEIYPTEFVDGCYVSLWRSVVICSMLPYSFRL